MKHSRFPSKDDTISQFLDGTKSFANTNTSLNPSSSFIELRDGSLKRRRQKQNYKDIYEEQRYHQSKTKRSNTSRMMSYTRDNNFNTFRSSSTYRSHPRYNHEEPLTISPHDVSQRNFNKYKNNIHRIDHNLDRNSQTLRYTYQMDGKTTNECNDIVLNKYINKGQSSSVTKKEAKRIINKYIAFDDFIRNEEHDQNKKKQQYNNPNGIHQVKNDNRNKLVKRDKMKDNESLQDDNNYNETYNQKVQCFTNKRINSQQKTKLKTSLNDNNNIRHRDECNTKRSDQLNTIKTHNSNMKCIKKIDIVTDSIDSQYFEQIKNRRNNSSHSNLRSHKSIPLNGTTTNKKDQEETDKSYMRHSHYNSNTNNNKYTYNEDEVNNILYYRNLMLQTPSMNSTTKTINNKAPTQNNFSQRWAKARHANNRVKRHTEEFYNYIYKAKAQIQQELNTQGKHTTLAQSPLNQRTYELSDNKELDKDNVAFQEVKPNVSIEINEAIKSQVQSEKKILGSGQKSIKSHHCKCHSDQDSIKKNESIKELSPTIKRNQSKDEVDDINLINMIKTVNVNSNEPIEFSHANNDSIYNNQISPINIINQSPNDSNLHHSLKSDNIFQSIPVYNSNQQSFHHNNKPQSSMVNHIQISNTKNNSSNLQDNTYNEDKRQNKLQCSSFHNHNQSNKTKDYLNQYLTKVSSNRQKEDNRHNYYTQRNKGSTNEIPLKSTKRTLDYDISDKKNKDSLTLKSQHTSRDSPSKNLLNRKYGNLIAVKNEAPRVESSLSQRRLHHKLARSKSNVNFAPTTRVINEIKQTPRGNANPLPSKRLNKRSKSSSNIFSETKQSNVIPLNIIQQNQEKEKGNYRYDQIGHCQPNDQNKKDSSSISSINRQSNQQKLIWDENNNNSSSTIFSHPMKKQQNNKQASSALYLSHNSYGSITDQFIMTHRISLSPSSIFLLNPSQRTLKRQESTYHINLLKKDLEEYKTSKQQKNHRSKSQDSILSINYPRRLEVHKEWIMPPNHIEKIAYNYF